MKTVFCLTFIFCLLTCRSFGTIYDVGPGQSLESIGEIPWESLVAGDRVNIHWRAEPYREKWVLCRQGTENAWIVVSGIPNATGELPVIDGQDATTRSELNFWNENRGVIKIGGANNPPDTMPAYIAIENLEIRSGRSPFTFTGRNGVTAYSDNCAAVYIEKGRHLRFTNCIFTDCGNGFFSGYQSSDIVVEHCYYYGNGIEGSIYQHNNYTESDGIVFQFNRFGRLREGCPGNNLKDRSAGTVIRYNWIEGGNRQLDLVDSDHLTELPSYRETFVYGNVLIELDGEGNSQILHYGGDSGDTSRYRKGTLYFFHNTTISTRSGNTTLMRLSSQDETADCRNNILYITAPGNRLAMLDDTGTMQLYTNWIKAGWVQSHSGSTGTIVENAATVEGEEPGFENFAAQDFNLLKTSLCIDAGGPLAPAALPLHEVVFEYVKHQNSSPRLVDSIPDLGAFEWHALSVPNWQTH